MFYLQAIQIVGRKFPAPESVKDTNTKDRTLNFTCCDIDEAIIGMSTSYPRSSLTRRASPKHTSALPYC